MDAAEFEGLSYTTFSENPFNKQKINIKDSEYDFTITDYVSQHFGMPIWETTACLSCQQKKRSKILKYDSFILSLE